MLVNLICIFFNFEFGFFFFIGISFDYKKILNKSVIFNENVEVKIEDELE